MLTTPELAKKLYEVFDDLSESGAIELGLRLPIEKVHEFAGSRVFDDNQTISFLTSVLLHEHNLVVLVLRELGQVALFPVPELETMTLIEEIPEG